MIQKKVLAGVAVVGLLAAAWAMMGRQAPRKALEQEPTPPAVTASVSTPEATPAPTPAPVPTPTSTPAPTPTPEPTPEPTPIPQPLFEEVNGTKYTNTQANVRDTYSTAGNKLTTLSVNTEVQVVGIGLAEGAASGWAKIVYEGAEAYIAQSLLSDSKIEIQQPIQQKPIQQPVQQQPVEEPVETPDKGIDPSLPSAGSRFGDHTGLEGVPSDTDYSKYTIK